MFQPSQSAELFSERLGAEDSLENKNNDLNAEKLTKRENSFARWSLMWQRQLRHQF